ncbi:hypothetical protein FACS1894105_10840 [Clostridia bacterium]|nr:hypothetical protein FACS1894105_10840 [Clostridia bacterium]
MINVLASLNSVDNTISSSLVESANELALDPAWRWDNGTDIAITNADGKLTYEIRTPHALYSENASVKVGDKIRANIVFMVNGTNSTLGGGWMNFEIPGGLSAGKGQNGDMFAEITLVAAPEPVTEAPTEAPTEAATDAPVANADGGTVAPETLPATVTPTPTVPKTADMSILFALAGLVSAGGVIFAKKGKK